MKTVLVFLAVCAIGNAGSLKVATFPLRHPVKTVRVLTYPAAHPVKSVKAVSPVQARW
jgi:hypothetical protein